MVLAVVQYCDGTYLTPLTRTPQSSSSSLDCSPLAERGRAATAGGGGAAAAATGGRGGSWSGSSRPRRQARSRTARAELTFSVSQVERRLREGRYAQRLSWSASVFLAATLECLTAKVLELAGNEARHSARRRITPELLDMAVHNNALLSGLFGTTTISQVAQPRR
uniref:histone H2A-Bbd type 2/3 n=2 Tax=Marmotini TaxID=337730 RepID=UPI001A9D965A|nr:histone H2A-Bbd type 2/3 [Ictidomys tridecemlineatus]